MKHHQRTRVLQVHHAHDALHVNICVADSGYPLAWLLTPLALPSTTAEGAYN